MFMDTINDPALGQMVSFNARDDAVVDLFSTNCPTLVDHYEVIPGISDHEMVFVESHIWASRQKLVRCKIHQWKSADINQVHESTTSFIFSFPQEDDIDSQVDTIQHHLQKVWKIQPEDLNDQFCSVLTD